MSIRNDTQRKAKRKARRVNPHIQRPLRSEHKPHHIEIEGACVYCGERRAVTRDHVIPRAVLRTYNATAPDDAPSVPPEWLGEVPACLECNVRKGRRRFVPPSWADQVSQLNEFFGAIWSVWSGDPAEPEFRKVQI
jgi:hypothetical protein